MTSKRTYCIVITLLIAFSSCRSDNRNAGEVMKEFADEFYSGRAQNNMTSVLNQYTDWPDFAVGNTVQIAAEQDILLLRENDEEAVFEIRFKVIGEESLAKVELMQTEIIQTYRLRRRRGQWKVLEPIYIPCVSVAGELSRLRTAIENASNQIANSDFTEAAPREYFEMLISNAQASIELLEDYR